MMRFTDEQTAENAQQYIVDMAAQIGMPFRGVTQRFAIPQAERNPLPEGADMDELGEPTGLFLMPNIPEDVLVRVQNAHPELVAEFNELFQPEYI